VERLEEARDALLEARDPELAAEACALLAEAWWDQGQNDRGRRELDRAQELVQDRPPSPSAARVLVEVSRYAMLADEIEEAIRTGREALAMAEELGLDELVPSALINIGSARGNGGDREGGIADLERAIEVAAATNNPDLARAYNNLAAMLANLDEAYELHLKGMEAAERLGNVPVGRFIQGQLLMGAFDLGRWDDFLREADEFITACEAGSPNYSESYVRERRADVRLARDELEGAAEDAARSLELARRAKDPQALQPALAVQIRVDVARGRLAEARRTARELLSLLESTATTFGALTLALNAELLGVAEQLPAVLSRTPERPSIMAASAVLAGDFARAADIAAENAWRPDAAELRLRSAEALVAQGRRAEADVQLAEALAFFRSVGATRFVRQGEALLAATA
jgi:tetratricopeptide (TPR) repeat protein